MNYKRNCLERVSARYGLMNEIARRKNCWNPKPSKGKSRAMQMWEDEVQALIDLLIDGEYIYDGFEWE